MLVARLSGNAQDGVEAASLALVAQMHPADVSEANKFLLTLESPSTLLREVEAFGIHPINSILMLGDSDAERRRALPPRPRACASARASKTAA